MSVTRKKRPARRRRIAIVLDLSWPYKRQVDVYHGILEAADARGWEHTLVPIAEGLSWEESGESKWSTLPFDGIIARATEDLVKEARKEGVPVVNVWANSPVRDDVPTVAPLFNAVGRRAARHLLARGLRTIGYLGARSLVDCRKEFAGMREEAREQGADYSRFLIRRSYKQNQARWSEFQKQLGEWIDSMEPPFGIFTFEDLLARYVIECCQDRGLRVPEDVAVVGNGNELPLCLQPEPTLTSVDLGFRKVGVRTVEVLDDLMSGRRLSDNLVQVEDSIQLMARHSTDVFAVEDPLVAGALRFISEHCNEPINVSDVVREIPASRRSLERRFTKAVNRTIAEEICRMRVRRLERLLVDSDEPLAMLAQVCGFRDTEQMRRNFHSLHGMTPSEFRRRQQG